MNESLSDRVEVAIVTFLQKNPNSIYLEIEDDLEDDIEKDNDDCIWWMASRMASKIIWRKTSRITTKNITGYERCQEGWPQKLHEVWHGSKLIRRMTWRIKCCVPFTVRWHEGWLMMKWRMTCWVTLWMTQRMTNDFDHDVERGI